MRIFLVISFLFLSNSSIQAAKPIDRLKAEAVLVKKCMDCHSDKTVYPWYYNLPIVKNLLDAEIAEGRAMLDLPESVFNIKNDKDIPKPTLLKIKSAVVEDWMPPIQYKVAHWDKIITPADKQIVSDWIARLEGKLIEPLPTVEEIKIQRTLNDDKIALGEKLFHDGRLSADNSISCATCHDLAKGGTDQKQFSIGINNSKGHINSPTVYNAMYAFKQFWDGRAETLEAQAHGPVHNPAEMGSNWNDVLEKIRNDVELVAMFKTAYGVSDAKDITGDMIANAIAEFEQTLVTPNSPFDSYLRGQETAIGSEEKQGYELFKRYQCATCHSGIAVGGQSFEAMGAAKDYFADRTAGINGLKTLKLAKEDGGRFNVTHKEADKRKFKVPTLRNIELTAPYMHDGNVKTLDEAVRVMAEYQVGKKINSHDTALIVKFLKSLTDADLTN